MAVDVAEKFNIKESAVIFSEDYEAPNGAKLLNYWRALKGNRERPEWSDFDFLDIIDITPLLIVKDVIDSGNEFRNRFWGTGHVRLDGFDGTGKIFADIYDPANVPDFIRLYGQLLINPSPMIMQGRLYYQETNKWQAYSSLCAGFTDRDGVVSNLVSAYDISADHL